MAAEPVLYRVGHRLGNLQLRRMPDSGENSRLPPRIARGRPAHARHRHKPVGVAADQQDRDADPGGHRPVAPRAADHPKQRTRRGKQRLVTGLRVPAAAGQRDRRLHQRGVGPRRVGETQLDLLPDGRLRRAVRQRPGQHLAEAGQREQREPADHRPVRLLPRHRRRRKGRVDQHKPGDGAGRRRRLQHRDQPAHGVADQDHRRPRDLPREPVNEPRVGLHGGLAPRSRGEAEPVQVQRHRPPALGQPRPDPAPVQVRAAQAVHEDKRRTARPARPARAELDPVHRAVQRGQVTARAPRRRELVGGLGRAGRQRSRTGNRRPAPRTVRHATIIHGARQPRAPASHGERQPLGSSPAAAMSTNIA